MIQYNMILYNIYNTRYDLIQYIMRYDTLSVACGKIHLASHTVKKSINSQKQATTRVKVHIIHTTMNFKKHTKQQEKSLST